jgi:hypothetical protein
MRQWLSFLPFINRKFPIYFHDLVFDELLIHIKKFPYDRIIQKDLQYTNAVRASTRANSLDWFCQVDRKLVGSKTIYSFRFVNVCYPEFYRTFEIKAHPLFKPITLQQHRYYEWFTYIGHELLNHLDKYLNTGRVFQSRIPHITKLFMHQKEEWIDIQFNFDLINERIAVSFEPGSPNWNTIHWIEILSIFL